MAALIVRREPTMTLSQLPSFIDEIWNDWTGVYEGVRTGMPMDMYEVKDELVLKAELPGFKKEDVDVSIEDGRLTVKGTKKEEGLPEGATSHMTERNKGEFSRTVTLPFEVDTGKIAATLERGVLEVRLPKREEAKARHIEVQVK